MRKLNAISLFSGAGGMDVGIRAAGFRVEDCIELDVWAAESLKANITKNKEKTRIHNTDISTIDPISLKRSKLDLLFGGPPCQSFSLAGKQLGLSDSRGPLLFEIIRFAQILEPTVILLEQVKGLLSAKDEKGKRGGVFEMFLSKLEDVGYVPKWRVLMAADYGVPQLRERLFVVATRGHNGYIFPERTHAPLAHCNELFKSLPYSTVGEVIKGLGDPDPKIKGQTHYQRQDSHVDVTPERDRERIAQVPEGSYLAAQTHLGDDLRRGLTTKDTTKYLRMHRSRPANTLRCGEIFYHPTENRYLTPREYMRIHGYPDSYLFSEPIGPLDPRYPRNR